MILRTGNCEDTDNSYERIASFSSGTVFDINKNELSTVLHFIKNSMNTNKVNLLSVDVMENHTNPYQRNLTIDESILSLRISVSGSKFELSVANPAGEIMNNKSYGMKTELNLENVKIVNILVSFRYYLTTLLFILIFRCTYTKIILKIINFNDNFKYYKYK